MQKSLTLQADKKSTDLQAQLVRRFNEGKALAEIILRLETRLKKVLTANKNH